MSFADIAALTLHDVKNRLAQLAGRAEARGDLDTLHETIDASNALTRLLTYYRSDVGTLTLDIDAHAPAELAAELIDDTCIRGRRRIDLDCSQAPTLWFYDETVVRMVLANAVQNAARYARARIVIEVAERSGFLEFLVRDDGHGYRQEVLDDATGVTAQVTRNGTGLGLRLARRIGNYSGRLARLMLLIRHGRTSRP